MKRFLMPLALLVMALAVVIYTGVGRSLERWVERHLGQDPISIDGNLAGAVEGLSEERPSLLLTDFVAGRWDFACVHETYSRPADNNLGQGILMTPDTVMDGYAIVLIKDTNAQSRRLSSEKIVEVQRLGSEGGIDCYGTTALRFEYVGRNEEGRLILSVRPVD